MNSKRVLFFIASLLAYAHPLMAIAPDTPPSWRQEALDDFKSPLTTDAKYALVIGGGLLGGLLIFKEQIVDPIQTHTAQAKPLGQNSRYAEGAGQGWPNTIYVLGMATYGVLKSDSSAKQHATSMLQASLDSFFVGTIFKYTIREKRPDTDAHESFPSGHTTAAFAFASYVGCRHALPWGLAAYSMAALVGFSRINDNRHYLHDVIGGATLGTSYGLGVCYAENQRAEGRESKIKTNWQMTPLPDGFIAGTTIHF